MTDSSVDLDPQLSDGLDRWQRLAVEVLVLRARADSLRGPRRGERALLLALRAGDREELLVSEVGLDKGARLLGEMADHPATLAAIERWRYAQELAWRLLSGPEATGSA